MTHTTNHSQAPSETGPLMNLIITLLAPIFLGVTAGDISLARMAAAETVNDYRARNQADLIAIAQIIAFGLAALGSLSLSMDDDMSLSMALRLRGNAVALNRSAGQNRRLFNRSDPAPLPAIPVEDKEPARFPRPPAEQPTVSQPNPQAQNQVPPAPTPADKHHPEMRAIAMVKEATALTASIANLSPAERPAATMRAAMLSSTAHDLLYGSSDPPLSHGALNGHTRPDVNSKPRLQ
jgi:hypothetical protein